MALHGTMKAPQHFQRLCHRLGIKIAIAENPFAQTGNFAILMQRNQASASKLGDTEPH
jgi:hypothetical protein